MNLFKKIALTPNFYTFYLYFTNTPTFICYFLGVIVRNDHKLHVCMWYEKGAGFICYTLDLMKENIVCITSLPGILLSAVP